jgi:hypothetical protein
LIFRPRLLDEVVLKVVVIGSIFLLDVALLRSCPASTASSVGKVYRFDRFIVVVFALVCTLRTGQELSEFSPVKRDGSLVTVVRERRREKNVETNLTAASVSSF